MGRRYFERVGVRLDDAWEAPADTTVFVLSERTTNGAALFSLYSNDRLPIIKHRSRVDTSESIDHLIFRGAPTYYFDQVCFGTNPIFAKT